MLRKLLLSVGVACFTGLVFAAALAVTMPAMVLTKLLEMPPQVEALSGTVWSGQAVLARGYNLTWDASLGGLVLGRIAAEVQLAGADTLIDADLRLGLRTYAVRGAAGRAGPGLLALAPGLPVTGCDSRAVLSDVDLTWRPGAAGAEGAVAIAEGVCTTLNRESVPVPSMRVLLATVGQDAVATLSADGPAATRLAQVVVAGDRRIILTVEPAGAMLVPGMPSSAPTTLEYPF